MGRAGAWSVLEGGCLGVASNRPWAPRVAPRPHRSWPGSALLHLHLVALEEIAPSLKTFHNYVLLFLLQGSHFFPAHYANQKASASQVEERKGMKFWMGTETREGVERLTHYPLNPHSLYLVAGSQPPSHPILEPQKGLWSLASMETTALGLVLHQPPFPTLPRHPKSKPDKLRPDPETGSPRTCFSLKHTGPHVHTLAAWPHQHVAASDRP